MLGRSLMGQLYRRSTLQPSVASRLNLRAVEVNLNHYSTAVGSVEEVRDISGSAARSNVQNKYGKASITLEEVIVIESETDDAAQSDSSRTYEDEDDVWADAYEYQEEMLQHGRLSQDQLSYANDKENHDPYSIARRLKTQRVAQEPDTVTKTKDNLTVSETSRSESSLDHFARTSQQYEDMPLPRQHKSLCHEEYFSMKNNPTKHGHPPVVIYVTNENQLNSVITLLQRPILSLDMEWIAWTKKKNISLIQLSDANTVLLIQISRFSSFPAKLREIIEDPSWVKCGVAIMGADASRLRDVYNVWAKGVCELSFFARLVDRETHGPKNNLIKLSTLAYHYLGSELAKGDVRCSNWSQFPLSQEQRHYAAVDAYAGYLIFAELERRRQNNPMMKNVWPPVSACPPLKSRNPQLRSRAPHESGAYNKVSDSMKEIRAVLNPTKQDYSSMHEPCTEEDGSRIAATFIDQSNDGPARRPRDVSAQETRKSGWSRRRF